MEKKTNWGVIIGVVIATVAVLAAGAYLAMKFLKKTKCECDECECDDCDICVLNDECTECADEVATDAE